MGNRMKCSQKRYNCIFISGEACKILSDTNFTRPCPFFKAGSGPVQRDYVFEGLNGVFREVGSYEGKYFVSDQGEVVTVRGRVLVRKHDRYGHPTVRLDRDYRKYSTHRVAKLVADAFLPPDGGCVIVHIDGDLDNCAAENLIRRTKNAAEEEN